LDFDLLALAAIHYVDDQPTVDYLLRASERLRSAVQGGLAVVDGDGVPVQFCWIAEFEGFRMPEVDHPLRAPSPESVILFDWWNPPSMHDRSYCKTVLRKAAQQLRASGKSVWIYSASDREFPHSELEELGFVKRFSLLYQRTLFRRVFDRSTTSSGA
jgi:hypothetical protein